MLDPFSSFLKSKEKDAFILLKEKEFLEDISQEPAIRVALREIKDFAVPFKTNDAVIWRFFTTPESEFSKPTEKAEEEILQKEEPHTQEQPKKEVINSPIEKIQKEKPVKKTGKIQKKNKTSQKENNFLDKVRSFLAEKSIEISDIIGIGKNELVLKIKEKDSQEKIIIAYNKKKIDENDIIRASKKASEFNLPYVVVSLGEPVKKINDFISASKNLHSLEKLK